jgi:hypothetical protein
MASLLARFGPMRARSTGADVPSAATSVRTSFQLNRIRMVLVRNEPLPVVFAQPNG